MTENTRIEELADDLIESGELDAETRDAVAHSHYGSEDGGTFEDAVGEGLDLDSKTVLVESHYGFLP